MSGGTAYIHDLRPERVNAESLASGELALLELGSADVEILTDLLQRHYDETGSAVALAMLADLPATVARFTKLLQQSRRRLARTTTSSRVYISPDTCSSRSCFGPRAWS